METLETMSVVCLITLVPLLPIFRYDILLYDLHKSTPSIYGSTTPPNYETFDWFYSYFRTPTWKFLKQPPTNCLLVITCLSTVVPVTWLPKFRLRNYSTARFMLRAVPTRASWMSNRVSNSNCTWDITILSVTLNRTDLAGKILSFNIVNRN